MRKFIVLILVLVFASSANASDSPTDIRFGILELTKDGVYALKTQTTKIPRKLKKTGFRFGIAFKNPSQREIEWYEVIHFPTDTSRASGYARKSSPTTITTTETRSDQVQVVDDFWFDEGDPLGKHRMDLVVNGKIVHSIEFEVVE